MLKLYCYIVTNEIIQLIQTVILHEDSEASRGQMMVIMKEIKTIKQYIGSISYFNFLMLNTIG